MKDLSETLKTMVVVQTQEIAANVIAGLMTIGDLVKVVEKGQFSKADLKEFIETYAGVIDYDKFTKKEFDQLVIGAETLLKEIQKGMKKHSK